MLQTAQFDIINRILLKNFPSFKPLPLWERSSSEGDRVRGKKITTLKFKKQLRQNQTDVEHILWQHLRNRQLHGIKFRRQHAFLGYIVDFVCLERKIVVELDGSQHIDMYAYDEKRTKLLEANGFRVLRFWNNDVLANIEGVLMNIDQALNEASNYA